ncbi:hypothetical protein [Gymnodinialimonas hymeniacidonis]|uniref:hypothetical protein n=1 Tax=Gymnodinialimonas hymeniacidonis TaxID=3126508 RepID=UPI0034C5C4E8
MSAAKWFCGKYQRMIDLRLFLPTVLLALPAFADADPPRAYAQDGPVQIAGEIETVFDWTTDRCEDYQIPDLPVRAFRNGAGQVSLILSHDSARRMTGPDFGNLTLSCDVLMTSAHNSAPDMFSNIEWIAATWIEGETVHALLHNEHQGNRYTDCRSAEYFQCWYNSITYARSDDAGATFERVIPAPDHLVANIPEVYHPDEGIFGAFSPSNIIEREGFYYAFIKVQAYPFGDQHTCLMRTETLGDPDSWRYWNGSAFEGRFGDPYRDDLQEMRVTTCTPIALPEIAQMYEGITWNTELDRFILVGTTSDPSRDPNPFGFYYALSEDLVNWEPRVPLLEVRLPWRAGGPETTYLYPTLIDHDAPGQNFDTSGAEAYLYFTRLNFGSGHLDRDLMRVRVEITP